MKKLIGRFRDFLHEREIARLAKSCAEAYEAGDKAKATHFFHGMRRAISERSSAQVRRMERRMGLHSRTAIKRNVMGAFLRGWLPAGVVAAAFRIFKLRGAVMREYGQIQSAFWQSADAESMSDRAKLMACYLLTGPYTNGLGCFRCTDGNLMDDLGWSSETVSETLSELYRIGFAYRLGKVVFLPNFLRWNGIANPKVAKARIKELETLPTNEAKALAARALLKFCGHLTDEQKTVLQTVSQTVSETVLQTLSKQNPTLPNPTQNQNQELPTTSGSGLPIEPPDPIFGTGLDFLRRKGVAEKSARSFLGLLRKEVGDLACAELLAKAEADDVSEPLAWLRAAASARKRTAQRSPDDVPDFVLGGRLMRAVEIANLLAGKVESVVVHLLPNGRRVGHEWRVGSVDGETGKSMGVHLDGEKAGVWLDGASGQAGDLVGLWMAVRRVDLRTACSEAMEFLGIREDRPEHRTRSYRKPDRDGVRALSGEHLQWLHSVRNLPQASIEAYRLASRGDRPMFPFLRGGELVFAKYRRLPKTFSAEADCEPILFGWQAIPGDARAVVICEGELDAIAWHAYGFPALSVPTGAGACAWIEGEFDALAAFDSIYLSMDMDTAGQKAIPELCERLGRERVKVVHLPRKDANQCLVDGISADEMTLALRDARTLDPNELRNASEFADAIWQEYTRIDDGLLLPWAKTHDLVKLRSGELSVWAGVNGHGKSSVVGHIVGALSMGGTRCCVASMEWRTSMWLARMGRQIGACARPSKAFSDHIAKQYRDTLWAFDVSGAAKAKRILDVFAYARRRYRIEPFVIDNLTKCGFADDDFAGQKQFVEALSDFARSTDCHVMLVAHMRKGTHGEGEDRPSGKHGIKGSGGITDVASTVVEVWRNIPREQAIARASHPDAPPLPEKFQPRGEQGADTLLRVLKQNATGLQPTIRLWYDPASTQFLGQPEHHPRSLVAFSVIDAQGLHDRA